ncbi:MAG: outer membrane protein transport protein [Planctomycetes bacterium]|nr:outer membrane protein transport protein [Planctomycetota bacterium]
MVTAFALLGCPAAVAVAAVASSDNQVDFGNNPAPMNAGARAMGMSAFVAIADDATAMAANPGGMIQLERAEASAAGGLYATSIKPAQGGRQNETRLDLDHVSAAVPFFAFDHQQTVGVIWQRQFDFTRSSAFNRHTLDTNFPTTDTTTDSSVTQTGAFSTLSLSYAIEVIPGLGLGITGSVWNDRITQHSSTTRYEHRHDDILVPDFNDETISDFDTATHIRVDEGYSAVMGAWWQATPGLALATVVKPGYKLHVSNQLDLQQSSPSAQPPFVQLTEHSFSTLRMPTVATIAAAWRQDDEDTVAAEVSWTQWSRFSLTREGRESAPQFFDHPASDQKDGISARVGYEHLFILPRVVAVARVGAFYEEQPGLHKVATLGDTAAMTVDRFYGLSAGGSLCYRHITYDLGGQLRYGHQVGSGQLVLQDDVANIYQLTVRLGATYQF